MHKLVGSLHKVYNLDRFAPTANNESSLDDSSVINTRDVLCTYTLTYGILQVVDIEKTLLSSDQKAVGVAYEVKL